jgi:hypothetical protein
MPVGLIEMSANRRPSRRCALACLLLLAGTAFAEPSSSSDKPGPVMLQVRLGPTIGMLYIDNQYAVAMDAGVAVDRALRSYLVASLQAQFERGLTVLQIPLGFQHDFPIRTVKGLYVYPRIALGYAAFLAPEAKAIHSGMVVADVGVKYALARRWSVGFEPFSVAVFFDGAGVSLAYRLLASVSVDLL